MPMMDRGKTVEAYMASFPKDVQVLLKKVRATIRKAAPTAEEKISYGMPGYKYNGKVLAYFGGFKSHVGFFATPSANVAFKKELSSYKMGKGSIQFPFDRPIPYPLITKMIRYKIKQIQG